MRLLTRCGAVVVLWSAIQAITAAQTPFNVVEKNIPELQEAMRGGTVTAVQLVDAYLARIEAYDRKGPRINSIIAINPKAREEAAALDRERAARGPRGPLHGIPLVIKDNIDMAGLPTTAGSLAFAMLFPADDAFQVKKLREAGAVILAKTNLQELASGYVTVGSMGGQTKNPYDLTRNPGGSSGGTGAAVAANFAVAGLGTDTCGSIRTPASHNALVGLRSTMGLASRDGVFPMSHSQDITGPLARTVADVAILLDATAGVDAADPVTKLGDGRMAKSYRDALKADALKGARIGVLRNLFGTAPEDNEAGTVVRRALDELKKQGAEIIDVAIPDYDGIMSGTSLIDAEFKADINEYLSRVPNAPVRTLGEAIDGGLLHAVIEPSSRNRNAIVANAEAAQRVAVRREAVRRIVTSAFDEHRVDAMAYPTMRRKPSRIGETQPGSTCSLSAVSGLPALSVPAGATNDGLPIGLELLGRAFDEARLLALAYAYEQASHPRKPPFSAPPLVNGRAPGAQIFETKLPVTGEGAGATLHTTVQFDPTTGELKYAANAKGITGARMLGAWIQRGGPGETGPAVYQVLGRGELVASGVVQLPPTEHARLREGRFYLAVYTAGSPLGKTRAQLR
jgi:amidase